MGDWRGRNCLVLDVGSGVVKAGASGEKEPRAVFPSIIGRPRMPGVTVGMAQKDHYIGEEAEKRRGMLSLSYPLEQGTVKRWDDMTRLLRYTFEKLEADPKERAVLMTEPPMNSKRNREEMMRTLFEEFGVPAMQVSIQAILALYACGKTTGLVLDSGDGVTHTIPVCEGYSASHAIQRMDFAGRALTVWLEKLLLDMGLAFQSSAERDILRHVKEQVCYVSTNYDRDMADAQRDPRKYTRPYELPDGNVIHVGSEAFRCPEGLFRPDLLGREGPGIHELVFASIQKSEMDSRKDLYENIVLSGGTTMLPNMSERIAGELTTLAPISIMPKVAAPPERKYSVWIGGSILCSLSTFATTWVTRAEYDERGVNAIHRRS